MKSKPLYHQKNIIKTIEKLESFALFMDYGTGKSYCILAWIEKNLKYLKNGVLIIGKKVNIHEDNAWPTEIKTHTDFTYKIISGPVKKRINSLYERPYPDLYLINYDCISSMRKSIINRKFDLIVFDESAAVKNPRSQRTKAAIAFAKNVPHRIIATGFPVSENLKEIWSQYYIVDRGKALGGTFWKFLTHYFYQWRFGWAVKKNKDKIIINKIKKRSVFAKLKDCFDLPPRIHRYITLEPNAKQLKYMNELRNEFSITISEHERIEFKHVLPILTKLQQICSGFIYINSEVERFDSPKHDYIKDLVEDISAKKIIWCKFNEEVKFLSDMFNAVRFSTLDSDNLRADMLYGFKHDESVKTLITTYDLLEAGETLSMCNYNIHYSYTWSNNIMTNAQRRTYRKGSEIHNKVVYIHMFIKNSIEEEIVKTLKSKKRMQNKLKEYMEKWATEF